MGSKNDEKVNKPSTGGKQECRGADGRFEKGNRSGGRKRIPEDVKEMMKATVPDAVRFLASLIADETARDADRVRAAEILLDRVYGKPQQSVDIDARSIPQVVFVGAEDLK